MGEWDDLAQLLKACWSLLLGNVVEWYEFAVYAELEKHLQKHFFRGSEVATWIGFAVTFLARPLGGALLGILGDTCGRKFAANLSIIGMLVATCGQGMLPTYASGSDALGTLGLAALVVLRFVQGLCAAGEISTLATYVTEVGNPRSMGRSTAFIAITFNMGFLSAKIVAYVVTSIIGKPAMAQWGWRIPFIFAIVPGSVAAMGRRWVPETEAFLKEQERAQRVLESLAAEERPTGGPGERSAPGWSAGIREVFSSHKCNILIGMGGVAASAVMYYGGFVWILSYLQSHGLSSNAAMQAGLCLRAVLILLAFPIGWLADVKGIGWVTFAGGVVFAVAGLPLFAAMASYPADASVILLYYGLGYAIMGSVGGTVFFVFVAELFPTGVRGVGVGISYNLGFALFGGGAPIAAQLLSTVSHVAPGLLYVLGGLITACSVMIGLWLQQRGVLRLAHVRPVPYFDECDHVGKSLAAQASANAGKSATSPESDPTVSAGKNSDALASPQDYVLESSHVSLVLEGEEPKRRPAYGSSSALNVLEDSSWLNEQPQRDSLAWHSSQDAPSALASPGARQLDGSGGGRHEGTGQSCVCCFPGPAA